MLFLTTDLLHNNGLVLFTGIELPNDGWYMKKQEKDGMVYIELQEYEPYMYRE
jgi:hypothetical protein